MPDTHVLILGGTAWLGRLIAAQCLARGHEVTCVARGRAGSPPPGAHLVVADRDDPRSLAAIPDRDWDVVVDLARAPGHARHAAATLASRVGHALVVSSASAYAAHDTPGADESATLLAPLAADVLSDMADYGAAKVACERAWQATFGATRTTILRPGLIGGPGDTSDRTGYWPARFAAPADPDGAVLVPLGAGQSAQVIDVRDLAAWVGRLAEQRRPGVFNAVGTALPLAEHLELARDVAGHRGPLRVAPDAWLVQQGVAPWAGPRSLPLWLPDPAFRGFAARDNAAALAAGLVLREVAHTLADTRAWEATRPAGHTRRAGLTPAEERELLADLPA